MITTYRNKLTNQYLVDLSTLTDKYKIPLIPLIECNREPCRIFLNRKHYTENYTPITRKEYLQTIYGRTNNKTTYAPTVIDFYTNKI